jgi:glycosyltransferase involved in cell wall biosynthesis
MKVLIYSHFFVPSIGGVETIVLSLARGLAEIRNENGLAEFEITLVTQTPAGNYDDGSLPFRVLRRPGLGKLLKTIRASDVVHTAGPAIAPLLLTSIARKPLIIEHHGYQATCPNGLLFHHPTGTVCPGYFLACEYRECLKCNNKIEGRSKSLWLLLSAFLRNAASRRAAINIAPSSHVATRQALPRTIRIAHGIEDPYAGRDPLDCAPPISPNNFAYLGRLVTEKGLSVLLKATRLLRAEGHAVNVVLIGDGPDRTRLQKEINELGLERNVRITGFLSGMELDLALRAAGTLVIPTTMEETAGLAAIEQMMRGRLVIASAVGGLRDAVDQAGLTFPPGDSAALAATMKMVMEKPDLIASLGKQARHRALALFLRERMIKDHASVYRGAGHHLES